MALTGAMGGLAAVLLSQTYYISPFSGLTPLIKGVSIALCGGLGSVQGAVIAAVLLGLVEAMTNKYLGGQYVLITQFLFIFLVLIVPAARYRGPARQGTRAMSDTKQDSSASLSLRVVVHLDEPLAAWGTATVNEVVPSIPVHDPAEVWRKITAFKVKTLSRGPPEVLRGLADHGKRTWTRCAGGPHAATS